ncbi:MAG: hypothetical protein JST33_00515 [Actinobacteria bacterium]|nr:hypothetical protein [Actinomycetota bacterium]
MKKQTKLLTAAGLGLALVSGGIAVATVPALAAVPAHQSVQTTQDNGQDGETADDTTGTGAQDNGQDGETADDTAGSQAQDNGQDGETADDGK